MEPYFLNSDLALLIQYLPKVEVHTVVHLMVGLAMLAAAICSASLTCLAKEEEEQGVVWAPQQGLAPF